MDTNITVYIPQEGFYSLFAEGSFQRKEKTDEYYILDFKADDILILFYHFSWHRRLYVTCNPPKFNNRHIHTLEGVEGERSVLAQLRGRAFDQLKRSLYYIKKETDCLCFSYPNAFWTQIIYLMQNSKNSHTNMDIIISRFKEQK